jgi:hypothetical protein
LLLCAQLNIAHAQLTVTEIHYNSDSTRNTGDWFELHNYGSSAIDLGLYRLRDSSATGLYLVQPGVSIPAGGYLVFCADTAAFDAIYSIPNRIGNLGFGLNNKTDGIRVFNNTNTLLFQVFYTDSLPWPKGADGFGRTLQLSSPTADPTVPQNWRTGCVLGSPGGPFVPCTSEIIVISEINYKSSPTEDAGDWFEIRNIGTAPVNIGSYTIRDDKNENTYVIPANTVLAPQGSVVVYDNPNKFNNQFPFVTNKVGPFFFNLSGGGDCLRIYNTDDHVIFSVYYLDDAPWPELPDGQGYTLEADTNFNFSRDVNAVSSWFVGCPEGSPGMKYTSACNLGIDDISLENNITVYPNPATSYIYIQREDNTGPFEVSLVDLNGRTVAAWKSQQQIPVGHLPRGMYFLLLKDSKNQYAKKLQLISYE